MKKIIINLTIAVMFFTAIKVKAQLPLQQGDVVATSKFDIMGGTTFGPVMFLLRAANTTGVPMGGEVWTTSYPAINPKPTTSKWDYSQMGSIFGITIDDNRKIYVANTKMYGAISSTKKSSIYMIDGAGTTGTPIIVASPTVPSGDPAYMPQLTGEFGNLKFVRIGGVGYIFVSDFGSKKIHCLKQLSTGYLTYVTSFDPAFGTNTDGQIPYGLAIRKVSGGTGYKLYYSRMGRGMAWLEAANSIYGTNDNEIWSVDINPSGTFGSVETKQILPSLFQQNPFADIAFNSTNTKMLCGQQSISNGFTATAVASGTLGAHQSNVYEFIEVSPGVWNYSNGTGINFYSGNTTTSIYANGHNAVGGVTYSNNILRENSKLKCDTAVWFSADWIYASNPPATQSSLTYVYGLQAMNSSGGNVNAAINIDLDDDYASMDKYHLGDVEVYNEPLNCNPCSCGQWLTTPTLNGQSINGVPIKYNTDWTQAKTVTNPKNGGVIGTGTAHLPYNYPVQFVKGNITGLINATYQCNGSCPPAYSWLLTNSSGGTVASGITLPIDLSVYNSKLDCGKYNLVIKAKCGTSDCDSYTIPITIICEPTNCCKNQIDISLESSTVNAVTNIPNPLAYSTGSFSFLMNFSAPMTEVRVNVEDFKLVANSPNCLNCNNRPVTWGNVLSASLNGTPMVLSGYLGVPSGTISADYREAVYNTGNLLMPSSAGLNIQLSLPTITELSCCEVSAYVCLKFTFKDANCVECVQMVCGTFKLVPKANPHWPPYDKKELIKANDIQKYKVLH